MLSLLLRSSHFKPTPPLFYLLSPLFQNLHTNSATPSPATKNLVLFNYLADTFNFPRSKALKISNCYSYIKTTETLQSVLQYLKSVQFSDAQIKLSANSSPCILFCRVETTLMPKISFFQSLGLSGSGLAHFLSKNPHVLTRSLNRTLIPCIDIVKKVLGSKGDKNHDLILALSRNSWLLTSVERLSANLSYLEECGIPKSQMAMLMKSHPRIFSFSESRLNGLVARALEMGFLPDSRMFVYGITISNNIGIKTYNRKLRLFRNFGFSDKECIAMFRKAPQLLATSEAKLSFGLEFFLKTIKLEKSLLVPYATYLLYSMGRRVVPRYRVWEVLKEKGLVGKQPHFFQMLAIREDVFVDRFISRFPNDSEELLMLYKS